MDSEGHALCASCIENEVWHGHGCRVLCLLKNGCNSQPFVDKDLRFRCISVAAYNWYTEKRAGSTKLDECLCQFLVRSDLPTVQVGVESKPALLLTQQEMLQRMAKRLDQNLAALSLLDGNHFIGLTSFPSTPGHNPAHSQLPRTKKKLL